MTRWVGIWSLLFVGLPGARGQQAGAQPQAAGQVPPRMVERIAAAAEEAAKAGTLVSKGVSVIPDAARAAGFRIGNGMVVVIPAKAGAPAAGGVRPFAIVLVRELTLTDGERAIAPARAARLSVPGPGGGQHEMLAFFVAARGKEGIEIYGAEKERLAFAPAGVEGVNAPAVSLRSAPPGGTALVVVTEPGQSAVIRLQGGPAALAGGSFPRPREGTVRVGDAAPDFTLKDREGKTSVTLSAFKEKKPVVLVFGSYT